MNRFLVYSVFALSLIAFIACGGNGTSAEVEADSLRVVSKQQQELLDELTATVVALSDNLDTIRSMENMIARGIDEYGEPLSKISLMDKLDGLKVMVGEKKSQLVYLKEKVNINNSELDKLRSVIAFLNSELAQKDKVIDELRAEINSKNTNISNLTSRLGAKEAEVDSLNSEVKQIIGQVASVNEVFYVVGTASELKNKGLLSGNGILQKKKVALENLDKSMFVKADTRTLKQIDIPAAAKKVAVMTGNSESSYTIESVDKSHSVLHITNPTVFWANIKYLIIKI